MTEIDIAAVELIEPRIPEGMGFYFKIQTTGQLFRVEPIRNPDQPRFWCLCVYRCERMRIIDPTERPWLGAQFLTREELPDVIQEIRNDLGAWLAQEPCRDLRRWLFSGKPATKSPLSVEV